MHHTFDCSSLLLPSSLTISLMEEMDPAPGVRVVLADAVLGGRAEEEILGREVGAVRLTSPLTEARGRGAAWLSAAGFGADADAAGLLVVDGANDARPALGVGALLALGVGAFPNVGVGALGTTDCRRAAAVVGAAGCAVLVLGGIVGLAVAEGPLADFLSDDATDVGFVGLVTVPMAFETAVGACLTVPDPNVPELMICFTSECTTYSARVLRH